MSTNGMERRLPGTVYVTLDDGYTCFFPVFSLLMRDSGYFKKILEERPGLEHFSHDLSLPRVRRDLWLPFEKFIMSRVLSLGDIPSTYRGIKEMALAGQNDIIRGKLDLEIYLLLELMLLSDRLDAPAFEKEVMDQLLSTYRNFYRNNGGRVPLNVKYVFTENTKNEHLRNFVADTLIFTMSERTMNQAVKEGYLSKDVKAWIDARAFVTEKTVRDAPWDHRADYNKPKTRFILE